MSLSLSWEKEPDILQRLVRWELEALEVGFNLVETWVSEDKVDQQLFGQTMLRLGKGCLDVGLWLVEVEKKLRCQSEELHVFNERQSCLESHLQVMGIEKTIKEFLSHTGLILGFNIKPYSQINIEVFYLDSIWEIFNAMK